MARYDASEAEPKWQEYWKEQGIHKFDPGSDKPVFSVDTPPPTVSGKMHLGHAFSYAQEDYIARFQRMRGKNVLYPFGTDDNGLPTERLVEKELKVRHQDYSREEFRKLCLEHVNENKPAFVADWERLGMSCDFEETYSTIDGHSQRVGQKSFLDLYRKGLVYRQETPISWCTTCRTAIAQAEFENVDMTSSFNDVIFEGDRELVIGTTRPELLPACVALCYHPSDKRYADLKGKHARVPLFGHEVPIIADENVDAEKGTGLMMVCTFGDKEDIDKWRRHSLPLRAAISDDGRMNELAGEYEGLRIKEARERIIEDLRSSGALGAQQKITHAVNVHERCDTEVEYLKKAQWFVRVLDHKEKLLEAADSIGWYPDHMKARYTHWVENLNWDWCVSRQRFYGVPIPVWYEEDGGIVVPSEDELPVDPLNDQPRGREGLAPESDVFDTWMISSVTPQIVLGWEGKTPEGYPMSFRPQGHDIIRTWAFYTLLKGVYHHEQPPWNDIMISGHVLDPKGRKMSKSKGNVVAPQDVLSSFGADALRYWAAGVRLGDDLPYMEKDVRTGQKTVTKLVNASRFALMHLEDYEGYDGDLQVLDRWLLSRLHRVIREATESFERYEYSRTRLLVDKFFWQDFCDRYLEFVKGRLYNDEGAGRKAAQRTLDEALSSVLKLFAPIMPHVTEEVYQRYHAEKEGCVSVHVSDWPSFDESRVDEDAEAVGDAAVAVVEAVRKYKSENRMSLRDEVGKIVVTSSLDLSAAEDDLKAVTRAQEIEYKEGAFSVDVS